MTNRTLRRLIEELGDDLGDDDHNEKASQSEPMKVLIYRANYPFGKYDP